jgi:para-nitrobenzyl esterase
MIPHALALVATLSLTLGAGVAAPADSPASVRIDTGVVVGRSDGAVDTFKAIPFAAPPVGALRWTPPHPAPSWTKPLDASADGPGCPQPQRPDGRPNLGGYIGPTSEDCLTVNVFAPHGAHRAPVLVWIYGGGNIAGANAVPSYDGAAFARDGVVVVVANYRLGALGFMAHPALTRSARADEPLGNYGIQDQIAALKWVQRNIKAFGGNPDEITLAGESAGGMNVLTLMTTPAARGLFRKASVESGGGWEKPTSLAEAESAGEDLAKTLGLSADATADQLRALPVDRLAVAGRFGPVIDGRLIPEDYRQAFAHGDQAPVPLIIGSNDFEASLLPAGTEAFYLSEQPEPAKALYAGEAKGDADLARLLFTDTFGGAPARWIAGKASKTAPTFLYHFTYVRAVKRGVLPGANHASEIPYVFDSQMSVPIYKLEIQDGDRAMARRVHSCWVAFIKTGAPACDGGPAWPAYTPADDRSMAFGLTVEVSQHWRKAKFDALDRLLAPDVAR